MKILKDSGCNKHSCNVSAIALFHDGSKIITGADDGIIKAWTLDLELISEFATNKGAILSMTSTPDALYTITSDQTITSWDSNTFQQKKELNSTLNIPQKLYYEPNSKVLWAGDSTGAVAQYSNGLEMGKHELVEEIWDLVVNLKEGKPLVYTARDRDVAIHQIGTGTQAITKATLQGRSPLLVIDDKLIFVSREGKNIEIHEDDVSRKFLKLQDIPAAEMIINALSAESLNTILAGGYDNKVTSWDTETGQCISSVNVDAVVNCLLFRNSRSYVTLSDGKIMLVGP